MSNNIRILILSPFTFTYGNKSKGFTRGDFFYLDPFSSADLAEFEYIILSPYYVKGLIYIDESVVTAYTNKTGIFAPAESLSEPPTATEGNSTTPTLLTREQRSQELRAITSAVYIAAIATSLGITSYRNKEQAIQYILQKEFPNATKTKPKAKSEVKVETTPVAPITPPATPVITPTPSPAPISTPTA